MRVEFHSEYLETACIIFKEWFASSKEVQRTGSTAVYSFLDDRTVAAVHFWIEGAKSCGLVYWSKIDVLL